MPYLTNHEGFEYQICFRVALRAKSSRLYVNRSIFEISESSPNIFRYLNRKTIQNNIFYGTQS